MRSVILLFYTIKYFENRKVFFSAASTNCYGDINSVDTTGASAATARQDRIRNGGTFYQIINIVDSSLPIGIDLVKHYIEYFNINDYEILYQAFLHPTGWREPICEE